MITRENEISAFNQIDLRKLKSDEGGEDLKKLKIPIKLINKTKI